MKAIRIHEFGGPEVMLLQDMPDLKAGPGQLVIKTAAIGVNPVDTYIRSGMYGQMQFPFTPGMECSGVVTEAGPDVKRFSKGERVYISGSVSGTYAQEVLCLEGQVHTLPKTVSFKEGAVLGVAYATAYQALFGKAQAKKGESVLVHGASGGVGIAAVQLAKEAGLKVIATAGTPQGIQLLKDQGVEHVLNHQHPLYWAELQRLVGEQGVHIILEMLADKNLERDLGVVAFRGRIVVIGCRGTITINPRQMMTRESLVMGMTIMRATDTEHKAIHTALIKGLLKGSLHPVIGREFSLNEAAAAHHAVMEQGSYGKIVLIP